MYIRLSYTAKLIIEAICSTKAPRDTIANDIIKKAEGKIRVGDYTTSKIRVGDNIYCFYICKHKDHYEIQYDPVKTYSMNNRGERRDTNVNIEFRCQDRCEKNSK